MTHPEPAQSRSLWFATLGGPITWSLYFLIGYGLVEVACQANVLMSDIAGLPAVSAIVVGLTLVALVITLAAGWVAYRRWQRAGADDHEPPEGRTRSMAFAGMLLSGLFGSLILITGIPALVLRPCG